MDVYNYTDFPALSFRQIQAGTGLTMACVTVKATCDLVDGGPLVLSDRQEPILYEDKYIGDPHDTSLIGVSDLIPFKPATDVTLSTAAWADHEPQVASISIGAMHHSMTILPRRQLIYRDEMWMATEPHLVREPRALSWRNTYGGVLTQAGEPPFDVIRENPLGCGAVDLDTVPHDTVLDVPSIVPSSDVSKHGPPWGCAPVPPWWKWRQQYAGTYDEDWLNEVHPRLPDDFDYRFYQVAPPPLICDGYLVGGEPIILSNLLPDIPEFTSALPSWKPRVSVGMRSNEVFSLPLLLDGCHFKLCGSACRVILTWRSWLSEAETVKAFKIETENLNSLIEERYSASGLQPIRTWPKWVENP